MERLKGEEEGEREEEGVGSEVVKPNELQRVNNFGEKKNNRRSVVGVTCGLSRGVLTTPNGRERGEGIDLEAIGIGLFFPPRIPSIFSSSFPHDFSAAGGELNC